MQVLCSALPQVRSFFGSTPATVPRFTKSMLIDTWALLQKIGNRHSYRTAYCADLTRTVLRPVRYVTEIRAVIRYGTVLVRVVLLISMKYVNRNSTAVQADITRTVLV